MQIDVKGRNIQVSEQLRERLQRRLAKISKQVSELARLEVELYEERNPSIADCQVAEATLYLKGTTLRARDASPEMDHSLKLVVDELARQVKRHRVKRRHRRDGHAAAAEAGAAEAGAAEAGAAEAGAVEAGAAEAGAAE